MSTQTMRVACCVVLVLLFVSLSFAGGPLYTFNGKSVVYKTVPIHYRTDLGPMGAFTSTEATNLAISAFQTWEDVPTSAVSFVNDGPLPVDVNGTNFTLYTSVTDFVIDGISPIIFDSDGAITDSLFGAGSKLDIIGFAGSAVAISGANAGYYIEGESVMNGYLTTTTYDPTHAKFTLAEFKSTFVHEFGHFIGLDHTQINGMFDSDSAKTKYIPTMYPTATANDVELGTLNPDDIVAISVLYPTQAFLTSTGGIAGSIKRANGTVVLGANVLAIDNADTLMNVYSTVSDYFYTTILGDFTFQGLASGSYWIKMEPIDPAFTGGSSVGPYAYDLTDSSFVNPVSAEYYNGANESGDPTKDNPMERTVVAVVAGATTTGINFVDNAKTTVALLSEDFSSAAGTTLTSAGWTVSGTATTQPLTIVSPGLTFAGYSGSGTGNAVVIRSTGQDVYKSFTAAANGAVYLSFMMKVDSAKTGDYFIALSPSGGQTNYFCRLHLKSSGAGYVVGISKFSEVAGGSMYGSTVLSFGATYVVVVKYEFLSATTTDDPINVFVFPSVLPSFEPSAKEIAGYTNAKTDATDLGIVTLRQGSTSSAPHLTLDGIRVTNGWPFTLTSVAERLKNGVPSTFELHQNFPNPFNPTTTIRFSLPTQQFIRLSVFDVLGRYVGVAAEGWRSAGTHDVAWSGAGLASGIYYYVLDADGHRSARVMVLIK